MRTFGVELEMVGISRQDAASVLKETLGGNVEYDSEDRSILYVILGNGERWKIEDDDSLGGNRDSRAEVVTPPNGLSLDRLEDVKKVVIALKRAGAMVNEKCGLHVHIGAKECTVEQISGLIDILIDQEPSVINRFKINPDRLKRYAKPLSKAFVGRFRARRPTNRQELQEAWYGKGFKVDRLKRRHDPTRYHGFNLHSFFYPLRRTIEFRYFNGTLDPDDIEECVSFCSNLTKAAGF